MTNTELNLNEEEEPPSTKCFISEEQILSEYIQDRLDREKTNLSPRSIEFIRQYFPEATEKDWTNWRWQLKNSVQTIGQLSRFLNLTDNEIRPDMSINNTLPVRITPYYLSLLEKDNPEQGEEPAEQEQELGPHLQRDDEEQQQHQGTLRIECGKGSDQSKGARRRPDDRRGEVPPQQHPG